MSKYANIIVDISHEKLDKTFQYRIPDELQDVVKVGVAVEVPFGNRKINGYVVELTQEAEFDVEKIKPIIGIKAQSIAIESQLIELAGWIKDNYGSTMNQALKTVIPIKKETKALIKRRLYLAADEKESRQKLAFFEAKHQTARARLLREVINLGSLDYSIVTGKLNVSSAVIKALEEQGLIRIESSNDYRNPISHLNKKEYNISLNDQQQNVVDTVCGDYEKGLRNTYLLKGVTGSGKTEVYMELISYMISKGKQAIVLIPEIALTYQTVMRFYNRFGDRVSIMNSRLSAGERYDQFQRAKNGHIDIMIGPRSALFTPFSNLGIIIIDEEHENSYKSETTPRYHAREVAIKRASMNDACVLLGSATPSVDSYYCAMSGKYKLLEMKKRVSDKALPECEIIDLRAELKAGNRSILSERLQKLMEERLANHQQIMLFLNRRGVSGFISCRECGFVIKCPHCDVSLSQHNTGKMVCHYCGYEMPTPNVCPNCGSKYISGFKAGTQKIEMMVQKRFPDARIVRMDFDTTRTKDSYEKILSSFANQEADILIGTQMIVKGHDFPNVTLVGVLAADMSLHVNDFHAAERTFQLLTQAAGRAGRGLLPGNVVIQTYDPDNFSIQAAKEQDYVKFYEQEIEYRQLMFYPPVWNLLLIISSSPSYEDADICSENIAVCLGTVITRAMKVQLVGPADASISKINNIFRKVIYLKTKKYDTLVELKNVVEKHIRDNSLFKNVSVQYDFNPMSGF